MFWKKKTINLFYLPALLLFAVFVLYPFAEGVRISFTNWTGYLPEYKYVGLYNYQKLFTDPNMRTIFKNTIIYGFGSTLFQNMLGLAFAVFLNTNFRGRSAIRAVIYLLVMIAPLIMGYIMFYILQYRGGALNDLVALFGIEPKDWLAVPARTVGFITGINTVQFAGISMVIYLAGLQNIPQMYIEAATIDGVGAWGRFRHITLPLLMPAITSSVTINLIGGLKLFDIIRALTSSSPSSGAHSLSTYLTYQYFNVQQAGYSAAIGIFTFLFILLVNAVMMKFFDSKETEML